MKKISLFIGLILSVLTLHAQKTAQQELDRAIYLEEVEGNLNQAMEVYQMIVTDFKDNRSVVAEALYRTGMVNEKLGNRKAASFYESIINNYSDQSRQVAMARKRLNTIFAAMNTDKTTDEAVSLRKLYSIPGRTFGTISHDGKYYCEYENLNLYLVELSSGKKTAITTEGSVDSVSRNANLGVWSLDNQKMAFNWHHGRNVFSLKIWDRETGKTTSVTNPGEYINPINWTLDGNKILVRYSDNPEVETNVGILNLNNGTIDFLYTQGPYSSDLSVISPDGKLVIYTKKSEKGDKDLYLYEVENKSSRLISGHSANEDQALWSHDGKSIIFRSDRSGNPALYEWKMDSGEMKGKPRMIFESISEDTYVHAISSSGEIMFTNLHSQSSILIANVDLEKGQVLNITELFDNATDLFHPRWSPDGNQIALVKNNPGEPSHIMVVTDLDGNIQAEIEIGFRVRLRDFYTPQWTHDGRLVMEDAREESKEEDWRRFLVLDPINGEKKAVRHPYNWNKPVFVSENSYYLPVYQNVEDAGIFKVDMETGKKEMIYKCPQNTLPGPFMSLSPDRNHMAFTLYSEVDDDLQSTGVMLMDINDHTVKKVFTTKKGDMIFWRPIYWRPDGKHIQFEMVGIDEKTGLLKDGEEVVVEVDIETGQRKVLPRLPIGKNETIPWRKRNLKYDTHPEGNKVLFKKMEMTTNFWRLKY